MERKSPVYLRVSDAALQEAADIEGFVPYAYDDKDPKSLANKTFITPALADTVEGTLTIGYGHTRTAKPGMRVTKEEALRLLRSDARDAESCVHRHVNVPLTQGEFDGLWDLFFNVGPGCLPNENLPKGKDGIACLGKTTGRPSTLLSALNDWKEDGSNYARAAECFTQWRNKGTVWEWGLLKRRIRFMLMFMNLPVVRAMNSLPNAMPVTDQGRYDLVQNCIRLAREEADDIAGVAIPAKPELPEIVLDKPLPPIVPAPEVKPAPPPVVVAVEPPKPAPPVSAKPPPPPPPPVSIGQQTSAVDATRNSQDWSSNAKAMWQSRRFWGLVLVLAGRLWMLKTGSNAVLGAVSDPLVTEMFSGFMVMLIGEVIQHWGERKATRPLK